MVTKRGSGERREDGETIAKLLAVIDDLLKGKSHSRRSIAAKTGKSTNTADRWIDAILKVLLTAREVKKGKIRSVVLERDATPTRAAAFGVCIAASLAGLFEGTEHERNLKDARDSILRQRGEAFASLDRKFIFAPRGGEYALPESGGDLDEVIQALLTERLLDFSYRHNNGGEEKLRVMPLSLVIFDHQFYVLAERTDESRTRYCFRFARMSDVDASVERFVYPSKSAFNPLGMLATGFGIHVSLPGAIEEIEVKLTGPWANYALTHLWHPIQETVDNGDGTVTVRLRVRLCPEIETWILGFGEFASVLKPAALRETVAARARAAAARHALPSADPPSLAKAKRQRPSIPTIVKAKEDGDRLLGIGPSSSNRARSKARRNSTLGRPARKA